MCDVTLPLTPLPYVTRRHNNVNPPPSSDLEVIYRRPLNAIALHVLWLQL